MMFAECSCRPNLGADPSVSDLAPGESYEKTENGKRYYCVRTVDDTGQPVVRCTELPSPLATKKSMWITIGAAAIAAGALITIAVAATRQE